MKQLYYSLIGLFAFTSSLRAQTPTLTTVSPARQAVNAPRTTAIQCTFSQAVTGASEIRVFSNRWRGHRTGIASGDGTATLKLQPTQVFAPGEQVSVTLPASVRGAGATGQALANGQVVQFRVAAGPATGNFTNGARLGETGTALYEPTLADVNNDGKLDFLVADAIESRVNVRLGDGLGSFGASTYFLTADNPQGIIVADFTNDGNLDLASVASEPFNRVINVAPGNGQGSFDVAQASRLPVTALPLYTQAADVNADGNLDLLFLEYQFSSPAYAVLQVNLGNGKGDFNSLPKLPLDVGYGGLRLADLNNDGRLDCLVANSVTGQLKTYLGDGTGAFALATTPALAIPTSATVGTYPVGQPVISEVADFTGDGLLDALILDATAYTLRLYPGTGQGGFGAAIATLTVPNLRQGFVADLEGDGDLDILATVPTGSYVAQGGYAVSRWLNNGTGSFTAGTPITGPATKLATGDINNDGTTDIVLVSEVSLDTGSPAIYPRLGQSLATAPTITFFSPSLATSGLLVTVQGTNLTGATLVLVGGVPVTNFTLDPATGALTFLPPSYTPGGLITVVTPTGTATSGARLAITVLANRTKADELPIQCYPNPTRGLVHLDQLAATGPLQADCYNSLGQLVRSISVSASPSPTLDLGGLTPGLYTLRLLANTGSTTRQILLE
ncbi:T9SS type A sorting domain-containing protein [Hymenobacter setariae]|uniref:T9SS type A sorting domain-containing protein n=1 Tax=Hymenobacter setariae TaxID=2594794 RepID=A0A558BRE6_9BACT|nr:FG-GAP-like repeat-containing protein [Hymenobacter setariae]TVT39082.1 T9SS type A sorting domain-containing protein [Hymenobacter setariae]